jgi:hypothetical protein
MLKKSIGIVSIISLLLLTACKKSFIELSPASTAGVDNLYKTDQDFKQAEIGIYNIYQAQYQNMWMFGDMRGDDGEKYSRCHGFIYHQQ